MSYDNACFVISPIGEPDSPERERSDKMLNHIIKPTVEEHGYRAVRADEISEPGIITNQILEYVAESPLVIADLTGSNPNVFYELAVRHAYNKPIIQIIEKGENIPFDVSVVRTIKIDMTDIASIENAKSEMSDQIESMESNDGDIDTPLSVARHVQDLKASDDPEDREIADMMEILGELSNQIRTIETRINEPESIIPPEYFQTLAEQYEMGSSTEIYNTTISLERYLRDMFNEVRYKTEIDNMLLNEMEEDVIGITSKIKALAENEDIDVREINPD